MSSSVCCLTSPPPPPLPQPPQDKSPRRTFHRGLFSQWRNKTAAGVCMPQCNQDIFFILWNLNITIRPCLQIVACMEGQAYTIIYIHIHNSLSNVCDGQTNTSKQNKPLTYTCDQVYLSFIHHMRHMHSLRLHNTLHYCKACCHQNKYYYGFTWKDLAWAQLNIAI